MSLDEELDLLADDLECLGGILQAVGDTVVLV